MRRTAFRLSGSCGAVGALASNGVAPLATLAMAVPFGIGQLLMAFVLYRATGAQHGEE